MAAVYVEPFDVFRGADQTFVCSCAITGGGTDRVFYFRVGRPGAVAALEKTMTESESTSTSVTLTVTLSAAETAAFKEDTVDFQIVCSSPNDVVTEGKLRMRPMIRAIPA